ncbi:hypothetical protein PWT90_11237 [Aphanocladium album]|nr:hypothetical protein PWT90_11237 [Aphanocladium album]
MESSTVRLIDVTSSPGSSSNDTSCHPTYRCCTNARALPEYRAGSHTFLSTKVKCGNKDTAFPPPVRYVPAMLPYLLPEQLAKPLVPPHHDTTPPTSERLPRADQVAPPGTPSVNSPPALP